MGMTRLVVAALLGGILAAGCTGDTVGRSTSAAPVGDRELPADSLHVKHPIALTAMHALRTVSANHPDIYVAGVQRGLELLGTDAPGIRASSSINYQTEKTVYELDLVTDTVAKRIDVAYPVPEPLVIAKAPDLGGNRAAYSVIREGQSPLSLPNLESGIWGQW